MKTTDLLLYYSELIKEKASDFFFRMNHKRSPGDFTRQRSLGFLAVILTMINFKTKSDALSLYNLLQIMERPQCISRQAFEEAKGKVNATAFIELFEDSARMSLSVQDPETFHGYRVCAIDGSLVLLPNSLELGKEYGEKSPVAGKTYARASLCADILNGVILDGEIDAFTTGERKLALRHVQKDLAPNLVYLFDRGYWDPALVAAICSRKQKFVIRLASNSLAAVTRSKEASGDFCMKHDTREYALRFYKFMLPSGEMEYLVTNLNRDEVPDGEMPDLYHLRWGVESKFDELKNRLHLESFSGKSINSVKQDFYASLIAANMTGFAVAAANARAQAKREGKRNKFVYKPNGSMAAGILKDRLIRAILSDDPFLRSKMIDTLVQDISRYVVPIVPDRHFPRNTSSSKNTHTRRPVSPL